VQVTEEVVNRSAQNHHHTMVRDKVQDFYGVNADCHIEIHDATLSISAIAALLGAAVSS
jgi:hypothetical protein